MAWEDGETFFMSIEDRNYYGDRRTRAKLIPEPEHKHWHFEVCDLCDGKGTVVNPSIDASGLTREDFDEDPDFAESYRAGDYDISCPQCGGKRVIPVCEAGYDHDGKIAEDDDSYPPPCTHGGGHSWVVSDETDRCYCEFCGADGDA